jgi:hypothetical protein
VAGDLADQAYGHCFVVLGGNEAAADAALTALRRAGRSRSSVLAHARYQALERAGAVASPPADTAAPDDLLDLAILLAATRPPAERAVLDLRTRLDRAELGRALGLPAAAAADRADAIGDAWDRDLDPLLMARLGPGDCLLLAAVLADADLAHPTLGELAAIGPAVAAHMADCELCTDRHRAMVSVRALLAQTEVPPAPDAVREAARRSRRMRPAPAPPAIDRRRRRPLLVVAAVVATLALIGGVAATAAALTGTRNSRAGRVAKLVRVPTNSQLALTVRRDTVELTNRSGRPVHWTAASEARWLEVRPADGRLDAGQTALLITRIQKSSPEGALRTTVTVTGDDGSAAAAVYETTIERPPDLATLANGCVVSATVEDASGLNAVDLLWTDRAGMHKLQMTVGPAGYTAILPPATPLNWWVTAQDTRGNQARTPETKLSC